MGRPTASPTCNSRRISRCVLGSNCPATVKSGSSVAMYLNGVLSRESSWFNLYHLRNDDTELLITRPYPMFFARVILDTAECSRDRNQDR